MAPITSLLAQLVIFGMIVFKDNKSSDSTLVSEAEAMKAFTKEQNGRAITWAAMVAFTAVMTFSIVPAAFSQTWSPEEIAEDRAAAEKGEAWAQNKLGHMYRNGYGWGVTEDYATAVKWYRKAAEQGYANAQFNLGYMYENGEVVPEDDATAVKWYTTAAEQGYANAQRNLGHMYRNGEGVPEDNVMAYMWWNLAAAQGDEDAKKNKRIVKERMTPAQIAEAQTLSRECLASGFPWNHGKGLVEMLLAIL